MDVVDVDKEEEGTQDSALGDSREDRARVGKCAVNKDPLSMALYCRKDADQLRRLPQMP